MSTFGKAIEINLFGESHGSTIGIVINNFPPGIALDLDLITDSLLKRRPKSILSTSRQEQDDFETEPGNQTGRWLGSYDINKTSRGLKELPDWLINNTPRPSSGRYTFTSWFYYDKDAPLQKAGLLGPVELYIDEN